MTSAASAPHVVLTPPSDFVPTDVEPPLLAEGSGAQLVAWSAWKARQQADALVLGCVATPIPGWVEDMRPAVEARAVGLAGAAAAKLAGVPVDARADQDGTLVLRPAAHLESAPIGRARAFVGFDEARVYTCFAVCAASGGRAGTACEAVIDASLIGSAPPPAPGLALRTGSWAIHHPRHVAWGAGTAVLLAGCLAVALRRRPRSRSGVR